jgi:hypothetical protein
MQNNHKMEITYSQKRKLPFPHLFHRKMPFHFRFHFRQKKSVSISVPQNSVFVFIFSFRFRFSAEKLGSFCSTFIPTVNNHMTSGVPGRGHDIRLCHLRRLRRSRFFQLGLCLGVEEVQQMGHPPLLLWLEGRPARPLLPRGAHRQR